MFSLFKRQKPKGTQATFKIQGMHCTSCALNIDGALEDTPGIISASTSYAKSNINIVYDEKKVSTEQIVKIIADLGYSVTTQ
jgi:copper chaperone CopZ